MIRGNGGGFRNVDVAGVETVLGVDCWVCYLEIGILDIGIISAWVCTVLYRVGYYSYGEGRSSGFVHIWGRGSLTLKGMNYVRLSNSRD